MHPVGFLIKLMIAGTAKETALSVLSTIVDCNLHKTLANNNYV
jgi:hypothetical protein